MTTSVGTAAQKDPPTILGSSRCENGKKRNLFATMMFSQGVAMIYGGDELSRTKGGNNNTYCQDNETNLV